MLTLHAHAWVQLVSMYMFYEFDDFDITRLLDGCEHFHPGPQHGAFTACAAPGM